jgi:hypothetical protein
MSLFQNIAGKRGEDIATEIVSYMLKPGTPFTRFQEFFFSRVINRMANSNDLQVQTATQVSVENGRPDLVVLTKDDIIVVETKLGSYLHGDNQLHKYCQLFENKDSLFNNYKLLKTNNDVNNILILLAPLDKIKASEITCENHSIINYNMDFKSWLQKRNIKYITLSWEEVISNLNINDFIQNELFIYINNYINQELTKDEKMVLKDVNVPKGISKLINIIYNIRDNISKSDNQFKVGSISQSYQYYAFPIEGSNFSCWYGYYLTIWENYGTPVFLQIRRDKMNPTLFEKITGLGFRAEKREPDFVKPFSIDSIDTWNDELINLLKNMS